jgi:hypothetical protein
MAMPKIIDAEDLSPRPEFKPNKDFEPNHEVHVTTDGILEGFKKINKTKEMEAFYDSVIPNGSKVPVE